MEGGVLKPLRQSLVFPPEVMEDIQVKAELGRYRFRGFGTIRPRPLPSFDDLTFLPCSLTRIPLEGYRERCSTKTVLGTRHAKRPIELEIPVMITGMSWGALSYNAKVALADSMYEGVVFVGGEIAELGNDAVVSDATGAELATIREALARHGLEGPKAFRKVVSGRKLWNYDKKELDLWKAAF